MRQGKPIAQERLEQLLGRSLLEAPTRSWPRDRLSGSCVHPARHDVDALMRFVFDRRKRHYAEVLPAARRALDRVDTDAVRILVRIAMRGCVSVSMCRRCERLWETCTLIDLAVMVACVERRGLHNADGEEARLRAAEDFQQFWRDVRQQPIGIQ